MKDLMKQTSKYLITALSALMVLLACEKPEDPQTQDPPQQEQQEEQLKQQIIPQTMESDFEEFWKNAVASLRAVPLHVERKLLDLPYKTFKAYEITFNTHDETMVRGYFCVPNAGEGEKLPCVAVFHGGGGYRGIHAEIVATGVCTFSMDTRSQGGKTFDRAFYEDVCDYNGSGIMAHGLADKENHYMNPR